MTTIRVSQVESDDLPAKVPMAIEGFEVAILDGFLGFRAVFEDAPSRTKEPLVVPAGHQPHSSSVSRCDTAGEFAVRKRRVVAFFFASTWLHPNGLVRAASAKLAYDFAEDSC